VRKRTFCRACGFWFASENAEHMGKPWNNESAEKWWACGRHVRQKELAPSAKVRRTTPKKFLPPGLPPYTVHLSLGVWGHCLRGTRCVPRVAPRVVGRYVLNAPEGCPHGTHTSGTAYTRGTCPHKHPQTQTNTQSTLCHGRANVRRSRPWQPQHRRKSHHRTSTRPTAGGQSPPSRSTRSCRIA
jgi:hypothetical protein